MNKRDFRKITEMLEENYNKKMDIRIFNLWYEELRDCSADEYENMIIEAIKTKKFYANISRDKRIEKT